MKKDYKKPALTVTPIMLQRHLLALSSKIGGKAKKPARARQRDDYWDDEEEQDTWNNEDSGYYGY